MASEPHASLAAPNCPVATDSQTTNRSRTLVVIATYNELENLPRLVSEILRFAPDADILVIDDNSPDGTGRWCDEAAVLEKRLQCLHRPQKAGLGTATLAGLQHGMKSGYDFIVTLDADFSHPPAALPNLRTMASSGYDLVIGSRYVPGGGIEGWPLLRRAMSRGVNWYARTLLRLPVRDCSGAFRCYSAAALSRIDLSRVRSRGYAYLEEILFRLKQAGAKIGETPIVFVDRQFGASKINWKEAVAALAIILRLAVRPGAAAHLPSENSNSGIDSQKPPA